MRTIQTSVYDTPPKKMITDIDSKSGLILYNIPVLMIVYDP